MTCCMTSKSNKWQTYILHRDFVRTFQICSSSSSSSRGIIFAIELSPWGEGVVLYDGAKMTLNMTKSLKCDDVKLLHQQAWKHASTIPHRHRDYIRRLKSTNTIKKFACKCIVINHWFGIVNTYIEYYENFGLFYPPPLHDTSTFIIWVHAIVQLKKVRSLAGMVSITLVY